MDSGVFFSLLLLVRNSPIVSETHVQLSEVNSDSKGSNLNPRFLEEIRKQVPVLLGENTCPQLIFIHDVKSECSVSEYGGNYDQVTKPSLVKISIHEERNQKRNLKVDFDSPGPVETALIWRLEVRIDIANEKNLGPPVSLARFKHFVTCVPNWPSAYPWIDCPRYEKDQIEYGRDFQIFSGQSFATIHEGYFSFGFSELK